MRHGWVRTWATRRRARRDAELGYKTPRPIVGRPSLIAPNTLSPALVVERPDRVWVTDITYIRTWQGWLFLAVIVDLFARKVVGWSMKPTLVRELVLDARAYAIINPQHGNVDDFSIQATRSRGRIAQVRELISRPYRPPRWHRLPR